MDRSRDMEVVVEVESEPLSPVEQNNVSTGRGGDVSFDIFN